MLKIRLRNVYQCIKIEQNQVAVDDVREIIQVDDRILDT